MSRVSFLNWRWQLPKSYHWRQSANYKWNYKAIEGSMFSSKGIFRITIIVWVNYNFNWQETKKMIESHPVQRVTPRRPIKRYNFGLVNCSFSPITKKS